MGDSINFSGQLYFVGDITGEQLSYLNKFLGEDRRELGYTGDSVYEGGKYGTCWHHVDLQLNDNFSGIEWNGAEKTRELEHIVNWLSCKMKERWPSFELQGELTATYEGSNDYWRLIMNNGTALKVNFSMTSNKITCPYCKEEFIEEFITNKQEIGHGND